MLGKNFTKRSAKNPNDTFPSKTGSGNGFPDYVFYENDTNRIIAIGDVKSPNENGSDASINGLNDCTNIYLKYYNERHKNKIRIAFGYDGINFIIKYLSKENQWDITGFSRHKQNTLNYSYASFKSVFMLK